MSDRERAPDARRVAAVRPGRAGRALVQRDALAHADRDRLQPLRGSGLDAGRPPRAGAHRSTCTPACCSRSRSSSASRCAPVGAAARRPRPAQPVGPRRPHRGGAQAKRADAQLGKFNPGQKLNATFIGAAIVVMLDDRLDHALVRAVLRSLAHGRDVRARLVRDRLRPRGLRSHRCSRCRDPDALSGIVRGWVPARWAKEKRPRWYDEVGRESTEAADSSGAVGDVVTGVGADGAANSARRAREMARRRCRCGSRRGSRPPSPAAGPAAPRGPRSCTRRWSGHRPVDPTARVVRAQRVTGFHDHAPVVAPGLGGDPRGQASGPTPKHRHRRQRRSIVAARAALTQRASTTGTRGAGRVRHEAGVRRAEHEAGHEVTVPAPEQLGNGSAHRVPDGDHRAGAEGDQCLRGVVGAVGQPEDAAGAQALPVAAQVRGDDVEVLRERLERPEPVEATARDPAVQEQQRGRAGRPGDLAYERRAACGEVDAATEGDGVGVSGQRGGRPSSDRGSHADTASPGASTVRQTVAVRVAARSRGRARARTSSRTLARSGSGSTATWLTEATRCTTCFVGERLHVAELGRARRTEPGQSTCRCAPVRRGRATAPASRPDP